MPTRGTFLTRALGRSGALFVGALLAAQASAAVIISTDVESTPLMIAPGVARTFTVKIAPTDANPVTISGWQFDIVIAPLTGAGDVEFNVPSATSQPSNYLFSLFNANILTETTGQVRAQDGVFTVPELVVIPQSGANLLDVSVVAQAGTLGTFGIYAVPGATNTLWGDESFNDLAFHNVPLGAGENILIGTISAAAESTGDFNQDGRTDGDDFLLWQRDYGATDSAVADGNGDGATNSIDLGIWVDEFGGALAIGRSSSMLDVIPEPNTLALNAVPILILLWRLRHHAHPVQFAPSENDKSELFQFFERLCEKDA